MTSTADFGFDTKHDRYPVAVHVFLIRGDGYILLARRAGSGYADGLLNLPSGHVDRGETPEQSAAREVSEEIDVVLDPDSLTPAAAMFRLSQEPRCDYFYLAREWSGLPRIGEPDKCTELVWADPEDLPADTVEFLAQAWVDSRAGVPFRTYGFQPATV